MTTNRLRSRLRRSATSRRRDAALLSALASLLVIVLAVTGAPGRIAAQTTTTTTTLPPLQLTITHDVPLGSSASSLPLGPANKTVINVTNLGTAPIYNQQIVVRVGVKPDAITVVRDLAGTVGVIDIVNGGWFHTIASITPGGTASFVVTWNKVCPGRFPIAARVGETFERTTYQWVGQAQGGVSCPPDETQSPQPASYYALPWPPTAATSTSVAGTPTVPTTAPLTTTSTTIAGSVVAPPTTRAAAAPPVTTAPSTTTIPTTTTKAKVTTTMVLMCRTVNGTRVCAPRAAIQSAKPRKTTTTSTAAKRRRTTTEKAS